MALITDYSSLKDALAAFQDRADVPVDQAIQLAEARLNRLLKTVETNATLLGTVGSRTVDITSLKVIEPITLFVDNGSRWCEIEPVRRPQGSFAYSDINSFPTYWAIDGSNLVFDSLLSDAYSIRFRYVGRFALSDAVPTNDLLTNNPDIYLAACIMWGGFFVRDDDTVARYGNPLNAFIAEQQAIEEKNRRGKLTVDPALSGVGRYSWWGGTIW